MQKHVFMLAIALVAVATPVFAATDTVVNVQPLVTELINDYVLPIVISVVGLLLGWLATLATKRLGISISAAMRQQVVDFAETQAKAILAKVVNAKEFNIDVKNPLIAQAAMEAEAHVGDALAAIGVTGPAVVNYVSHLIVAHLGELTKDTPDAPTPAGAIAGTNVAPDGATVAAAAA